MLRRIIAASAAAAALLATTTASAEPLGTKGQFILSAERIFPLFSYTSVKDGPDSDHWTTMSLLADPFQRTFYNVPRFAFDYAVIDHLTIGGALMASFDLSHGHDHTNNQGIVTSGDSDKVTMFGIAPRVGYVLNITDTFAFWPRGGFAYYTATDSPPAPLSSENTHQLALNLEPVFAWLPVEHFGFVFGPVVDVPLTGAHEVRNDPNGITVSQDYAQFHIGITAGLLGYF
jgi:hypothetical protein